MSPDDAKDITESGNFRRPIYKVMHHWFGDGVTHYGGRKNFTDMRLDKGEKLEQISLWMGHRSKQLDAGLRQVYRACVGLN